VASASFGAGVAFNARAVVTYGPLPDLGDQEAFVEEVHRHQPSPHRDAAVGSRGSRRDSGAREGMHRLQGQLDDQHERLRDMTQQVAISGLPLEMTGVLFVVAGILVQGVAQVIR